MTKLSEAIGNKYMAKTKKQSKQSAKELKKQRYKKRRLLTSFRIFRYGVSNFSRNAWLTAAATAVMTVTLLIIFVTVAANNVMVATIDDLKEKVDMSIYLKSETTVDQGEQLVKEIEKLQSVKTASFVTSSETRENFVQDNRNDPALLEALKEASNRSPAVLRVVVNNINDTSELQIFTEKNNLLKEHIDPAREPSFAGKRRDSIASIGQAVTLGQRAGIVASLVFVVISSLIIFNTIRMAIFNRREEIYMMQLIGADKSFIRGPFIIEAMMYGVLAALVATGLGALLLFSLQDTKISDYVSLSSTLYYATSFWPLVLLGMIFCGITIGVVSSSFATRRYLKL